MIACCFVNSDDPPVSTRHISWRINKYSSNGIQYIELIEIREDRYPHPQAPDNAFVYLMREYIVDKQVQHSHEAAHLHLLEYALNNIDLIQRKVG